MLSQAFQFKNDIKERVIISKKKVSNIRAYSVISCDQNAECTVHDYAPVANGKKMSHFRIKFMHGKKGRKVFEKTQAGRQASRKASS